MSLLKKIFGPRQEKDGTNPDTPDAMQKTANEKAGAVFDTYVHDGLRAMQAGEFPFAERCFRAALAERDDLRTQGFLAEVLIRMNRAADAIVPLRKLCAADAQNVEALTALCECLDKAQLFDELAETTETLGKLLPADSRVTGFRARIAEARGDFFTAIALLTQAIANEPANEALRFARAGLLLKMKQGAEAIEDAETLARNNPESEQYAMLKAESLAQGGRTDEAVAAYEAALALNPFSERSILALAALYDASGHAEKAIDLLDEAIDNLPDFSEGYRLRGGLRLRLHDKEGAMDDLKKAMELRPEEIEQIDGEFTNTANQVESYLKQLNPYGF